MRQSPSPYGFRHNTTTPQFNQTPTSEMNHIHGGVWIGSHKALSSATPLLARNIRFVVNTAIEFITETPELINWSDLYNNGVQVHNTYWDDTMTQTIYPSPSMEEAVHKITDVIRSNGCVLVNCAMGKSRSTSLVIAWLMAMHSMTYDQALATCKKSRPQCQPNKNFERQLRALENQLSGSRHGSHAPPPPAPSSLYPAPTPNPPFSATAAALPSTPSRPPPLTSPISPSNVGKPYPLTLPSQMNGPSNNPYSSPSHTNGPNASLPFGSPSRAPYTPSSPYSNSSTPTTPSGMHFPMQHPSSSAATASRFERSPSRPNGLSMGQFPLSPNRTNGQNSSTVTPLIPPYSPRGQQQGQGMNGINPQYPSALQRSASPPPQFSSLQSPVSPLSRSTSQHPTSPLSAFNRSTSPRITPQQATGGNNAGFTSPLRGQSGPQHTHPFMLRRLSL